MRNDAAALEGRCRNVVEKDDSVEQSVRGFAKPGDSKHGSALAGRRRETA
jgi:hypothetical protein